MFHNHNTKVFLKNILNILIYAYVIHIDDFMHAILLLQLFK